MKNKENYYADIFECKNYDEVLKKLKSLHFFSDDEHVIRSIIIDLDGTIDSLMRRIFYENLLQLVAKYQDEEKIYEKLIVKLYNNIEKQGFWTIYEILRPCLYAFLGGNFSNIEKIHNLRNKLAHKSSKDIQYKKRNPFNDHDCLAEVYLDFFEIHQNLKKFYQTMIDDPRRLRKLYAKYYNEHKQKREEGG